MKIALIVSGAAALILTIIGSVLYARAHNHEDAAAKGPAIAVLKIGLLFASVFFIIFLIALVMLVFRLFKLF